MAKIVYKKIELFLVRLTIQMERVMGIGPTLSAWKAGVLPLNYTCIVMPVTTDIINYTLKKIVCQDNFFKILKLLNLQL